MKHHHLLLILLLTALFVTLLACESEEEDSEDIIALDADATDTEADRSQDIEPDSSQDWYSCAEDSDCILFEAGCCDHCNGGSLVSVNSQYESQARASLTEDCSLPVACTEMGCTAKEAFCNAGSCAYREATHCESFDQAACESSPACTPILGAPAEEICIDDFTNWKSIYAGCMRSDQGCGEAESCAINPTNGQALVFPNTCIPSGWSACDGTECEVPSACAEGEEMAPAHFCVSSGEAENSLSITIYPSGCHSSSCTIQHQTSCSATLNDDQIALEALFCLEDNSANQDCTEDCGGGGSAQCGLDELAAGSYTPNFRRASAQL